MNAGYDFYAIRKLYDAGHEIALHTISHLTDKTSTLARWRQEIAGEKRLIESYSGLPAEDINGFRAPNVQINDSAYQVLHERQFRYDASVRESLDLYSTAPTNMIWPYTLDHGLGQLNIPEAMPATNYPGLFEIPIWVQLQDTTAVALTDPPETLTSNEVSALWKTNFLARYNGNRAPYGLFLHATWPNQWLSNPSNSTWRVTILKNFISWALEHTNTWFITCNDLIDYMNDPVPATAAAEHPSFQTQVRTPFPTSDVVECYFPGKHTFYTCGVDPLFPPDYKTALMGAVWQENDAVTINVASQNEATAWCTMIVSNDTPYLILDWNISFTLGGGNILSLYDASWNQDGSNVTVEARDYNDYTLESGFYILEFRVSWTGGDVIFNDISMNVQGPGPLPINMDINPLPDLSCMHVSWDNNAYVYTVECSTNLVDTQGWTVITNDIAQPEITIPCKKGGVPHFFRVKGTVY